MSSVDEWVVEMLSSVDAMDMDRWLGYLHDDVRFRYGSQPELQGKAAVREAVTALFASLHGLHHDVHDVWQCSSTVICRGDVRYDPRAGSPLTVPFVNVLELDDEQIRGYLIYIDPTPLLAASPGGPA